jgi:hypothetical protein
MHRFQFLSSLKEKGKIMEELNVKWEEGKICQIADVVWDLEKAVEKFWKTMGFGPWYFWDFEPPDLRDVYYRGIKVESSAFRIALAQIGPLQYEIMQPMYGIGIHREFLEKKGEGLHHIKIYYKDIPKALEEFKKKGIYPLQSGKFDEDWHVYLDTEKEYGIIWEIGNQGRIRKPYKRYPE